MVYTRVYLVCGTILSLADLRRIFEQFEVEFPEEDDYQEISEIFAREIIAQHTETVLLPGQHPIGLVAYPCCSSLAGEQWILGTIIKTYYRLSGMGCARCEEYTLCDPCIGETEGGWYDVEKILDEVQVIDREKICPTCSSDKVVGGRCQICHAYSHYLVRKRVPEAVVPGAEGVIEEVVTVEPYCMIANKKVLAQDLQLDLVAHPVKFFYMLDDCLSCT